MGSDRPCAVFVANRAFAVARSRLRLATRLVSSGWRVIAATGVRHDEPVSARAATALAEAGVEIAPIQFGRRGFSPRQDWCALQSLRRLYRDCRPQLVHHFNARPVLLGTWAARMLPEVCVFNTITGLGHAFIRGGINRVLATTGYHLCLPHSDVVIFQNSEDRMLFINRGWVKDVQAELVVGSGVDTGRFQPRARRRSGALRVVMASRLLWQKGVGEYLQAAQIVRDLLGEDVRFLLAGDWDTDHPDAVFPEQLAEPIRAGLIEQIGHVEDMPNLLQDADLVVLPSYREGVPRVLLEAAACGVPVVTTDVAGCRDAVIDGVTGRLAPARDAVSLAASIAELLSDEGLRRCYGQAARQLAERQFDERLITEQYLALYARHGLPVPEMNVVTPSGIDAAKNERAAVEPQAACEHPIAMD